MRKHDTRKASPPNALAIFGALAVGIAIILAANLAAGPDPGPTPPQPATPQAPGADRAADQTLQIRWRSGTVNRPKKDTPDVAAILQQLAAEGPRHVIVQFARPVEPAEKQALSAAGVTLLNYLGDHAFFASVSQQRLAVPAVAAVGALADAQMIDRSHKLHPMLLAGEVPSWAVVTPDQPDGAAPEPKTPTDPAAAIVGAYVLFHPDVRLEPDAVNLARRYGAFIRSKLHTVNGLVIELPYAAIAALADEDAVQWIEPPLPRMGPVNNSNRSRTGADVVQAAPYGLTGAGVNVLVYDAGTAFSAHPDFGGRLFVRDTSGTITHATHVSGTVGGSGASSGGTFKGMAPGVTIQSYGFEQEGGLHEGFLYTDPGDIEADYGQAINTFGAVISNNSIGTNTASNGFPCDWEGDYGVTDTVIDSIVRGSLGGGPFRIVWANGNERSSGRCGTAYHTTAPPACAKNHITVGALNSNDDSMTGFSSWGPADDGRMKPDVSAPGCQSNDDFGVTSCASGGGYTSLCGTSMASPTVCGLSALLLQDYRAQFPGNPDFRNSTLKILLAHTAVDRGNTGPDYQFGYGSVRIQPAVDFMRTGNFLENSVGQGGVYSVLVIVNPGDPQFKATLAWDDPAGTPNVSPALVNDLDLVVFDPSNTQRFPWTLNPASPANPAVRTQADHVNNIEQVQVDAPAPGVWRVEVRGFNVPNGPQPFSLCASPLLVNCSTQGVISLDRAKYACASTATIQVVDCDLNTDDGSIQTVDVTINSTSEPAGETVTLTETAPETATFRGSIALSTTDGPGVLHVAHGDAVSATYIDADDGFGGTNVVVTDDAVVDCAPPVVSNVQATNIGPRTATITFNTDEPAAVVVRYGTNCGALNNSAGGSGVVTSHSVALSGLEDNTAYFFVIDATDEAGNAATADNGGNCYAFSTPEIPDFFTEIFEASDNDLDNLSIMFTPNGTYDYYADCAESITALPTDPAGGTNLNLPDDSPPATITLSGGATVSLYGVSYSTFYVSPNGYITFVTPDTDYTESLADHFNRPRISALFDDLNPAADGQVLFRQLADRAVATWQAVPEYGTSNSNTFQIEMFFDGRIHMSYLSIAAADGLAGLSAGAGLPPDFFESDLSAAGACGPRPPTAQNGSVTTPINTPITIALSALDDGLPDPPATLTYIITSLPANGSLSDPQAGPIDGVPYALANGGNEVTYTPDVWYAGAEVVQFKANDNGIPPEGGDSNTATVAIGVRYLDVARSFPLDDDPVWSRMGQWKYGQPTGEGSFNGDPTSGYTGPKVYGYNIGGDYANNITAVQYLTTSAINCSALVGCQLRFRRWLGIDAGNFDHANIQVSNNGTSWTTVWDHTGGPISESAWSLQSFDISAVADGRATVFVRWGMGPTNGSVTYPGWNIDDVEIWASAPSPCPGTLPGDVSLDGGVDAGDVQRFVAVLVDPGATSQAERCAADVNLDFSADENDVSPFIDMLLTQEP